MELNGNNYPSPHPFNFFLFVFGIGLFSGLAKVLRGCSGVCFFFLEKHNSLLFLSHRERCASLRTVWVDFFHLGVFVYAGIHQVLGWAVFSSFELRLLALVFFLFFFTFVST